MKEALMPEFDLYKHLMPADGFTLLDLGSGSQQRTMHFNFSYCHAVDLDTHYHEETNARLNTEFIYSDVVDFLKVSNRMWDVIAAFEVVEHLLFCDALELMKEIKRHTKKLALIITPDGFSHSFQNPDLIDNPYEHRCGFTQDQYEWLGWSVIRNVNARIDMKPRHDKERVPYPPTWDRLFAYWRPDESV